MNKLIFIVLVLVLAFSSVFAASNPNVIKTSINKNFTIKLNSNPTTGYQWQLIKPLDAKSLKLVSSNFIPPKTTRVGAGGVEVWTFKALRNGKTSLTFGYLRSWEKGIAPMNIASFEVEISK